MEHVIVMGQNSQEPSESYRTDLEKRIMETLKGGSDFNLSDLKKNLADVQIPSTYRDRAITQTITSLIKNEKLAIFSDVHGKEFVVRRIK